LRWARDDARQCDRDRGRSARRRKRSTEELVRENENFKKKLLKYLLKKRNKIFKLQDLGLFLFVAARAIFQLSGGCHHYR
jgi:hypothetical protein